MKKIWAKQNMLKSSQFGLHIKNYDSKNDARAKYFKKSF